MLVVGGIGVAGVTQLVPASLEFIKTRAVGVGSKEEPPAAQKPLAPQLTVAKFPLRTTLGWPIAWPAAALWVDAEGGEEQAAVMMARESALTPASR